jgi:phage gp46-like protein
MFLQYITDVDSNAFGTCDISFTKGDPLTSAILMSLFCYSRGTSEEAEGNSRYGWWAGQVGSKIWTQLRTKIQPKTLPRIKQIIEDSLEWIITDGIANSIDVMVWQEYDKIKSTISINKNDGKSLNLRFEDLWEHVREQ